MLTTIIPQQTDATRTLANIFSSLKDSNVDLKIKKLTLAWSETGGLPSLETKHQRAINYLAKIITNITKPPANKEVDRLSKKITLSKKCLQVLAKAIDADWLAEKLDSNGEEVTITVSKNPLGSEKNTKNSSPVEENEKHVKPGARLCPFKDLAPSFKNKKTEKSF